MKEQKVNEISAANPSIPRSLLAGAVDIAGTVNEGHLAGVVAGYRAGASGMTADREGEIKQLSAQYYQAQDRKDPRAMRQAQDAIFALGGRLAPRT